MCVRKAFFSRFIQLNKMPAKSSMRMKGRWNEQFAFLFFTLLWRQFESRDFSLANVRCVSLTLVSTSSLFFFDSMSIIFWLVLLRGHFASLSLTFFFPFFTLCFAFCYSSYTHTHTVDIIIWQYHFPLQYLPTIIPKLNVHKY